MIGDRAVREIQAHHVDAGAHHVGQHRRIVRGGTQGRDDLGAAQHGASCGALLENFDRGKFLAFDEFEECAAAGRYVGNAVLDAVFLDGGERIAAAGQRKGLAARNGRWRACACPRRTARTRTRPPDRSREWCRPTAISFAIASAESGPMSRIISSADTVADGLHVGLRLGGELAWRPPRRSAWE